MTTYQISDEELADLMEELEQESAAMVAGEPKPEQPAKDKPVETAPTVSVADAANAAVAEMDETPPWIETPEEVEPAKPIEVVLKLDTSEAQAAIKEMAEQVEKLKPAPELDFDIEISPKLKHRIEKSWIDEAKLLNEQNLDDKMYTLAGDFAYAGGQAALAERQAGRLKIQLKQQEALLCAEIREQFIRDGKKATEKMIEEALHCDQRWKSLNILLVDAEWICNHNRSAVTALTARREMTQHLANDRRVEMKGVVRVMAQEESAQQFTDQQERVKASLRRG